VILLDNLREKLRFCHAAINLNVMFIQESEILSATQVFAVKFTDILNRHKTLFGPEIFSGLNISKSTTLDCLEQVMMNIKLRLRERYAMVSLREEQLVKVIADLTGPIRACADTILRLEGKVAASPKEALLMLAKKLPQKNWDNILSHLSIAREEREMKKDEGVATVCGLLELLDAMFEYIQSMRQ